MTRGRNGADRIPVSEGVPLPIKDLRELGEELGLNREMQDRLIVGVQGLATLIETQKTDFENRPKRPPNKNRDLKNLCEAIERLEDRLHKVAATADPTLRYLLADFLAGSLSNSGFGSATGKPIAFEPPSFHLLESRAAQSREGPGRVIEEHYQIQRRRASKGHEFSIQIGLFQQTRKRVETFIELDRIHSRGGARGRERRNFLIVQLANFYPDIFNTAPTGAPGGNFCRLCALVLPWLGEDTNGLEVAIQRRLRKTKK